MERRPLGKSGLTVPKLCLGTMMYGEQISERDAFEQMDICLERGVDFFDTAEMYTVPPRPQTQGESERIIGRWVKARGAAGKVMIASKVAGRAHFPWLRPDGEETRLTPAQIRFAVDRSLANLGVDCIDLYQLHWTDRPMQHFGAILDGYKHYDDAGVPLEETLRALDDLIKAGKIRHVGVSNETPWGVMTYTRLAQTHGLAPMQSIQNAYHLMNRTFELGLAEIAHQESVGLLAYSPLAQGALSGKYLNGARPAGARDTLFGRLDRYKTPAGQRATAAYCALADELGIDRAAMAFQFVTTRSFVTSNIFGATSREQLEIALGSVDLAWTDDLEKAVNAVHADMPNPCP